MKRRNVLRAAAWLTAALTLLLLLPAPAEPDAASVMTAAEQAVYADILLAAAEGRDTAACDGIVSHTKILTQLGIYYGRLSGLSGLYTWENGVLRLNLGEFSVLEQHRLELEARVTELMGHVKQTGTRFPSSVFCLRQNPPSPKGRYRTLPIGEGGTRSVTGEGMPQFFQVLQQKRLLRQIARVIAAHRDYIPGEFVCGDYAILFHKLAQRVGIRTELCFGRVNGTLHAWNQVSLGGRARYYDITWYDGDLPAPRYLCSPRPWGRTAQTGDKWLPEP